MEVPEFSPQPPKKNPYAQEWGFFKTNLSIKFGWLITLSFLFTGFFYFSFLHNPAAQEKILETIVKAFQEGGLIGLRGKNPLLFVIKLFYTNLRATLAFTLMGFIPYFVGTIVFLFSLSILLGVTLALTVTKGFGYLTFFKLTAPHGIFELCAVFYGASLAVYLSREVTKKLSSRNREDSVPFVDLFKQIARSYILFIIPLLIWAAVVETLITPLLR